MRTRFAPVATLLAAIACGGESPQPTYSVYPAELDLPPMRYNDTVESTVYLSVLNESYFPLLVDQFAFEGAGSAFLAFEEAYEKQVILDIRERAMVTVRIRQPTSSEQVLWSTQDLEAALTFRVRGSGVYDAETMLPDLGFVETVLERVPITFALVCDFDGDGADARSCGGGRDCDDGNWTVNPSAVERCDGFDNNCDNVIDQDCVDEDAP